MGDLLVFGAGAAADDASRVAHLPDPAREGGAAAFDVVFLLDVFLHVDEEGEGLRGYVLAEVLHRDGSGSMRVKGGRNWMAITYFLHLLVHAGWSAHLLGGGGMKGAVGLKIVCNSSKLPFGHMMVLDDGLVILSSEQ